MTTAATMQGRSDAFDTPATRRAHKRQPIAVVLGDAPHRWVPSPAGSHVQMYTNFDVWQYKAQLWSTGASTYFVRIRGQNDIHSITDFDEAQTWTEETVARLIEDGHNFYAPVQGETKHV